LVKTNLKNLLILSHRNLLRTLDWFDSETIYIEGGLGSQILGTLEFMNSEKLVDISYFSKPPKKSVTGPDIWEWQLGRYGIGLDFFRSRVQEKPWSKYWKLRPEINISVFASSDSHELPWRNERAFELFPIDDSRTTEFLLNYGVQNLDFGSIHVRRGDYLRVSSRVIQVEKYSQLLSKIKGQLPKLLFVFSDSDLSTNEKREIRENTLSSEMIFVTERELESGITHDLMRISKLLVTSNSTFSYSAGLLASKETTVYSPLLFFGGEDDYLKSRIFNQRGDFYIFR
jgi:hypothetical protein